MQHFLLSDELNSNNVVIVQQSKNDNPVVLSVTNEVQNKGLNVKLERVCANWTTGQLPPTLHNVSFDVDSGNLCAIVGLVGSGKTAILSVLLKELQIGAGTVCLMQKPDALANVNNHRRNAYIVDNPELQISYASQDAWLFTATVKQNILFGQTFDEKRYKQVIDVRILLLFLMNE